MRSSRKKRQNSRVSLDTKVLVRVFVDDPDMPRQTEQARKAVAHWKQVYVTSVVQVETLWVLKRAYGFGKSDLLRVLEHWLVNRAFVLENAEAFTLAVEIFRDNNVDFSDALILAKSREQESLLLTFDAKLARLAGAEKIDD